MEIKEYENKVNELLEEIKFYAFKCVSLNKWKINGEYLDGSPLYDHRVFAGVGGTEEAMDRILIYNYFYSINDLIEYIKKYYYARKGEIYNAKNPPEWALVFTKKLCVNEVYLSAQVTCYNIYNREYTIDYPKNLKEGYSCIQKIDIRQTEFVINNIHFSKTDLIDIALSQALEKVETEEFQEEFYSWYCEYLSDELVKYKRSYLWLLAQNYKYDLIALDNGNKVIVNKNVKRGPTLKRKRVGAKIN